MGIFSAIGSFFKSIFSKAGTFIAKMFQLAQPFLQEVLSGTAQKIWQSSQDMFISAVAYVAEQGYPTDDAKRDAFVAYLRQKGLAELEGLKTSELNLLRETALAIYKKASSQEQ